MKLRYTTPAARDLDRVLTYLAERSPQGARHVQARIQATTYLLLDHPHAGQRTSRGDTRRIVVSPYPFLIFYRVTADAIVIRAVRHGARDPASMPGGSKP